MPGKLFLILAACLPCCLVAQEERLAALYTSGDLPAAYAQGREMLCRQPGDPGVSHVLGRISFDLALKEQRFEYLDSARLLLEQAAAADAGRSSISGWSWLTLAKVHYLQGRTGAAGKCLDSCFGGEVTRNLLEAARRFRTLTDPHEGQQRWAVHKGSKLRFHFQESFPASRIRDFIDAHEAAFEKNNLLFQAQMPKCIDLYVWTDEQEARRILRRSLGFAEPGLLICHIRINQTTGHEITHILTHYAWGIPVVSKTRLINEGLAVCFDITNESRDRLAIARKAIAGYGPVSVRKLWEDSRETDESVLFPVAGAFVQHLYQHSSEETFGRLVKNQTLAAAESIYGNRLDTLISTFEQLLVK